ncbi:MAG: hypothetical protein WBK38_07330 [Bacteroidia bacterium]
MITEITLPSFLSDIMKCWLKQYHGNELDTLTSLGLFHWEFRPNRRLPEKLRRRPMIDKCFSLKTSLVHKSIYFHEVDPETLHAFESGGLTLAGFKVAFEYKWDGKKFIGMKKLFSMIS